MPGAGSVPEGGNVSKGGNVSEEGGGNDRHSPNIARATKKPAASEKPHADELLEDTKNPKPHIKGPRTKPNLRGFTTSLNVEPMSHANLMSHCHS